MPTRRMNFTQTAIKNLPVPTKRTSYWDAEVKRLLVDVRPSGSKSFYVYKKINGRPEKIFLGAFPDLTVEKARQVAAIKLGEIALGKNPQDEKRKFRKA